MNGLNQLKILMIKLIKKVFFDPRLGKLKIFILVGTGAVFIDYIFNED